MTSRTDLAHSCNTAVYNFFVQQILYIYVYIYIYIHKSAKYILADMLHIYFLRSLFGAGSE